MTADVWESNPQTVDTHTVPLFENAKFTAVQFLTLQMYSLPKHYFHRMVPVAKITRSDSWYNCSFKFCNCGGWHWRHWTFFSIYTLPLSRCTKHSSKI